MLSSPVPSRERCTVQWAVNRHNFKQNVSFQKEIASPLWKRANIPDLAAQQMLQDLGCVICDESHHPAKYGAVSDGVDTPLVPVSQTAALLRGLV
jgi:hypothetical protein